MEKSFLEQSQPPSLRHLCTCLLAATFHSLLANGLSHCSGGRVIHSSPKSELRLHHRKLVQTPGSLGWAMWHWESYLAAFHALLQFSHQLKRTKNSTQCKHSCESYRVNYCGELTIMPSIVLCKFLDAINLATEIFLLLITTFSVTLLSTTSAITASTIQIPLHAGGWERWIA